MALIPLHDILEMLTGAGEAKSDKDIDAVLENLKALGDAEIDFSKYATRKPAVSDEESGPPLIFDLLNDDKPTA